MYFDGSTPKSKRRLSSPLPSDFESFREKYEVITKRMAFSGDQDLLDVLC